MDEPQARPAGIEGVELPGPFPVGAYAARLKDFLQDVERVQVFGELFNLRLSRARAYFELRDGDGAIPCAIWRNRLEAIGLTGEELADGVQLVLAGGPDYYPGSRTASPGFSFDVTAMKVAGEGDLLAQLERLRRQLDSEGLFEPQRLLPRSRLPRTIGVVTGETGKARDDILAGLRRRGWEGRLVWAFAPVQD
ncbi:MAG: exodeoxyribonuclease VII large subunit, partial [Solirubrobacterales bacterium]